ncbi:hypothetical protein ACQ4PT_032977 [Festuca glaucescens]
MARSSSVTEAEVGISCFTSSSLLGFRGVLKHRYSDFIVHEVARDGSVVRLTSLDLPDECVEPKEEEKAAPSADADHSQALEKFSGLCGEADCSALRGLIEKAAAGSKGDFSPVILSPDADKAHRSVGLVPRFNLCKENKDTQDALGVIGKMLGLQSRAFGFSGTKDKRAVTTQQVTVFKVPANKLAALNKRLYGIKVGNFCYVKEGLGLGQLMGNRFSITLRGVVAESEDVIKAAVDGLGKNGFINYYGLQRDDVKEVREHYKQHGDIDMALRNFPRHLVAERSIVILWWTSPSLFLYMLTGDLTGISRVIEGDLIYSKESCPEEATSVGTSEADDGHTNSSELDICSEILPEENIQSVKIVDSEDLLKGIYSFEDVVLPLPGSQALFPGNEVAEIYHEMAKKDGISLTESAHGVK